MDRATISDNNLSRCLFSQKGNVCFSDWKNVREQVKAIKWIESFQEIDKKQWRKNRETFHEICSIRYRNVYCLARTGDWALKRTRENKQHDKLYDNHSCLKAILFLNYSFGISTRLFFLFSIASGIKFASDFQFYLLLFLFMAFFWLVHWLNISYCRQLSVFNGFRINTSKPDIKLYEICCAHENVWTANDAGKIR